MTINENKLYFACMTMVNVCFSVGYILFATLYTVSPYLSSTNDVIGDENITRMGGIKTFKIEYMVIQISKIH